MSNTHAKFNQADIARSVRAAKQAGATGIELRSDGTIFIHLSPQSEPDFDLTDHDQDDEAPL